MSSDICRCCEFYFKGNCMAGCCHIGDNILKNAGDGCEGGENGEE